MKKEIKSDFTLKTGIWLKSKRLNSGHKQEEVAVTMRKTRTWVSEVEHGKQSIMFSDIIKLCELYEADIDECYNFVKDEQ